VSYRPVQSTCPDTRLTTWATTLAVSPAPRPLYNHEKTIATTSLSKLTRNPDNVFVGDSIFQPDVGSARADFPGGSAPAIYDSCRDKLLALPDETKIWVGHDYPPSASNTEEGPRGPRPWATVREHKQSNKHLHDGVSREDFVEMRSSRDSQLSAPRLIDQALRVNICGGRLDGFKKDGDKIVKMSRGMI